MKTGAGTIQARNALTADPVFQLYWNVGRSAHLGYPLIGRMRGRAELRGAFATLNTTDF